MTTTPMGVESDGSLSRDEAANALLSRWTDADPAIQDRDEGAKPIRRSETERAPDKDENQSDDEELDFGDEDAPVEASPDALVTLTVDGEEIKIPVKDLTRLYGQEASLTRKSQEVAERRKFAEDEGARYVVATQRLLTKAQERFQPYAQVDWAIAAKTLDNDEYIALRTEAQAAHADLQFLNSELDGVFTETKRTRETQNLEDAKAALEVLQRDIPNFTAEVYQDMTAYAVTQGLPEDAVHQLTDPTALKLIHKAMAYDRAKERAASKRKAAPTSKRTMTTTRRSEQREGNRDGAAMTALRKTGSRDDAVAAMMERWSDTGDQ